MSLRERARRLAGASTVDPSRCPSEALSRRDRDAVTRDADVLTVTDMS